MTAPRPDHPVPYPLVVVSLPRAQRLSLDDVARRTGLHPELVRRFVALGLLEAERDASGELRFGAAAPLVVARIQRLHAGLCLNYAAIGLVLDLLDRIDALQARLRTSARLADPADKE